MRGNYSRAVRKGSPSFYAPPKKNLKIMFVKGNIILPAKTEIN